MLHGWSCQETDTINKNIFYPANCFQLRIKKKNTGDAAF